VKSCELGSNVTVLVVPPPPNFVPPISSARPSFNVACPAQKMSGPGIVPTFVTTCVTESHV
jgi:hypothetical protein